jgi:hypothetical protein
VQLQLNNVHMKLRLKGSRETICRFHSILAHTDGDWPFVSITGMIKECDCCGGVVYRNPIVTVGMIKEAGRQAGLRTVKIKRFAPEAKCNARTNTTSSTQVN